MNAYLPVLAVLALVGSGIVTGLLFAFANFVLRALDDLPAQHGMFAMQRINERILNPVFLTFFLATPLLCAAIALSTLGALDRPGHLSLLLGAVAYLAGPLAITLRCNVPLNNRLADTPVDAAALQWPLYQRRWQRWNHARTALGMLAMLLLASGLAGL